MRKQRSSSPATHPTSTPRPNPSSPDGVQAGHAAGRWQCYAHFASSAPTAPAALHRRPSSSTHDRVTGVCPSPTVADLILKGSAVGATSMQRQHLPCAACCRRSTRWMRRSPKLQCESGRSRPGSSRSKLRTPASARHCTQPSTGRDSEKKWLSRPVEVCEFQTYFANDLAKSRVTLRVAAGFARSEANTVDL